MGGRSTSDKENIYKFTSGTFYPQLGPAQQPHRCPLNKNKYFHNKTGNISRLAAARVPNVPAAARYLLELSTGLFSQCPGWPRMELHNFTSIYSLYLKYRIVSRHNPGTVKYHEVPLTAQVFTQNTRNCYPRKIIPHTQTAQPALTLEFVSVSCSAADDPSVSQSRRRPLLGPSPG